MKIRLITVNKELYVQSVFHCIPLSKFLGSAHFLSQYHLLDYILKELKRTANKIASQSGHQGNTDPCLYFQVNTNALLLFTFLKVNFYCTKVL